MQLPPLSIPKAARIPVRLTGGPVSHPTSGYRNWAGQFGAPEPIVALAVHVAGSHANWSRTCHRGTPTLETQILFSPYDAEGLRIRVSFGVFDATAIGRTQVASRLTQPAPLLKEFVTGELVEIADIPGDPPCKLMAIFLVRTDVKSVRNGVWHLRGNLAAAVDEPWHKALTWGRTGEFNLDPQA